MHETHSQRQQPDPAVAINCEGIGSFAVKGGNQWVEASAGHVRIKGLKLLAVVCNPLRTKTNTSPRVSTKDDENRKQEN